uniref:Uncharacterized protein n=1 Tax=Noccaea caerulescens TaxID=107243 RepID=A0A1J3F003_NOCCA
MNEVLAETNVAETDYAETNVAETDNAEQLEPEETIAIPTGPLTRSKTKALTLRIGKVLSRLSRHDDKPTTLVCLKAQPPG